MTGNQHSDEAPDVIDLTPEQLEAGIALSMAAQDEFDRVFEQMFGRAPEPLELDASDDMDDFDDEFDDE